MELDKERYDAVTSPMQAHLNIGFGSDLSIAIYVNPSLE